MHRLRSQSLRLSFRDSLIISFLIGIFSIDILIKNVSWYSNIPFNRLAHYTFLSNYITKYNELCWFIGVIGLVSLSFLIKRLINNKITLLVFISALTILLGVISNGFDLLLHGFIKDYLTIFYLIFNLADILIIGGIMGMIYSLQRTN